MKSLRLLAILGAAIAASRPAMSCTCTPLTFEQASSNASVIALVEVTSVTIVRHPFQIKQKTFYEESQDVQIDVHATWKGDYSGKQRIPGAGICGVIYRSGEQYLVYGSNYEGTLQTSYCTGTREYSRAEDYIGRLGVPKWADSSAKNLFPRKSAGLSVSVTPVKSSLTMFDEVAFNVTFQNYSNHPILLPSSELVPNDFLHLVVTHKGEWWSTIRRNELREGPMEWTPLAGSAPVVVENLKA